jgi:hypothetical protein
MRDSISLHSSKNFDEVELPLQNGSGASCHEAAPEESHAIDMEHGDEAHEDASIPRRRTFRDLLGEEQVDLRYEVAVREDDTFAHTRGTRGVEESSRIILAASMEGEAAVVVVSVRALLMD